jgi:hypothetical protein
MLIAGPVGNKLSSFFKSWNPEMRKIPNSSRRLDEHISRALNQIKKPSTAEEITELLNRDLEPEDPKTGPSRLKKSQSGWEIPETWC